MIDLPKRKLLFMQIFVGMSGGVDSSVTALLLKEQGHNLTGAFMKNWQDGEQKFCSSEEDFADVRAVCDQIGIPYCTFNFEKEYQQRVFAHFLEAFKKGYTPNPDILCNREIKFDQFLNKCLLAGAEKIATGHYARIRENADGSFDLLRGVDQDKDQSYFLAAIDQKALSKTLFPLGELAKPAVRKLAEQAGLKVASKKDSTGICFIGERDFSEFLSQFLPAQPGKIVDLQGEELGEHQGTMYYTIGQRKGLGIGGPGGPWFVADKDVAKNLVVVVEGEDHPALFKQTVEVTEWHWINPAHAEVNEGLSAQVRYRQMAQPIKIIERDSQGNPLILEFEEPQRAVTPGQQLVLYCDDVCLGSGVLQ